MAGQYGQTWWGKQWLAAFNGIDDTNRLPRGRRYAGNGSVSKIDIQKTSTVAEVQGRQRRPYRVRIHLPSFTTKQQKLVLETVSSNPAVLARLLNRQLPEQTLQLLSEQSIPIFPRSWREMTASCSCPDWAMPCKHIAAVIYLLANEIDKNPFLVFELHGMDLIKAMEKQSGRAFASLDNPPPFLDSWQKEPVISDWQVPESPVFDSLDLTTIPRMEERIFGILTSTPLFYEKDFREVMASIYKRTAKCAFNQEKEARKIQDQPLEITGFDSLTLMINEHGQFHSVISQGTSITPENISQWCACLAALHTSENPDIARHFHHALMWQLLYRLALKLVSQQAYVPAIYQDSQKKSLILWQPALLSDEIQALLTPLYECCPPDLVALHHIPKGRKRAVNFYSDGKTQINAALNSMISLLTTQGLVQAPIQLAVQDICQLFFGGVPCLFNRFETVEYPGVIRNWLNRLYLGERQHRLHLVVEEILDQPQGMGELSVAVHIEQQGSLCPLQQVLATPELSDTKVSVLTDLALLADYLPDIEQLSLQNGRQKQELTYTLQAFTPLFQRTLPALQMLGIRLVLPKALRKLAYPALSLSLLSSKSDAPVSYLKMDELLQFNWKVAIGDQQVSIEEFKKLVEGASGLVRMLDQYVMLDNSQLQQLLKKLEELPESLSRAELLKAGLSGTLDDAKVHLSEEAKTLFEQLLKGEPAPIPEGLNAQLRPYQQRGFEWMVQNARIGFGSLLADDMGLGKTLQVITLLLHQKESGQLEKQKALVVAPTSLLTNWRKEIERFAPTLSVQIYHGSERELKQEQHDIVLTSYGLTRSDITLFKKHHWRTLVIDEAQNIKNPTSQQAKAIKSLKADIRIGLSGTPVENRLSEYWSLFDYTNKGYLGTQKTFQTEFALPIERDRDQNCLERFRKITEPFILRRMKSDKAIINDLPDKVESDRYCQLSPQQASLYQSTVNTIMDELESGLEGIERKGIIFKLLNALKQICNSPAQFLKHDQAKTAESGKLATFLEIIREAQEAGEKTLVFTQYTTMGELLVNSLTMELGLNAQFLHGGLSRTRRDKMVDDFQNDPRSQILILSLKAGGTGLNLTAASQVIHYDLWWNPAVEAQATDRAYRIGQKRSVQVHRLITEKTFEEKIDEMIQSKKELAKLTVASGETWITELSDQDIRELVSL